VSRYGQVALALAARICGKKAIVVVAHRDKLHPLSRLAQRLGAEIEQVALPNHLVALRARADEIVASAEERGEGKGTYVHLPFGMEHPEIIQRLSESIATALPPSLATAPPRRLWLACGSGVILRALGSVWPKAKFGVVQVGKTIYDDICEGLDFTLHVAPERFAEPASEPPRSPR